MSTQPAPAAIVARVLLAVGVLVAVAIGWRLAALGVNDLPAPDGLQATRSAWAEDPVNVLDTARRQLDAGELEAAARAARTLLARAPLQAEGFLLLARAAEAAQDPGMEALFKLAVRRSPRDRYARVWVIGAQLRAEDYTSALGNIDVLLHASPAAADFLYPLVQRLTAEADFTTALLRTLQRQPLWRGNFLGWLVEHGNHRQMTDVYRGLQARTDLAPRELDHWLRRLMHEHLWEEAYRHWQASLALPPGAAVAGIYNGDFARRATGIGFDWRLGGAPGVSVDQVVTTGGHAVQLHFLGRRVPHLQVAQTLLLAPGEHEVHFRARGLNLSSDRGLQWTVRCLGRSAERAESPALRGNFAWHEVRFRVIVPPVGCAAQELALVNPGADGPGKIVSGSLWVSDFSVQDVPPAAEPATTVPP